MIEAINVRPCVRPPSCGAYELSRFVRAQAGIHAVALAELAAGRKRTHWIWFEFPQIAGLGHSATARLYALRDLDEARAYGRHELLGPRLLECTDAMLGWAGRRSAQAILDSVDAMKFRSSMTLFEIALPLETRFSDALAAFCEGKRDEATLDLLAAG